MRQSLGCLLLVTMTGGLGAAGPRGASAHDPALEPAPVITPPGPEYADSGRAFQGIPTLERAGNGRLWAAWYGGGKGEGPLNYVLLATSGDAGETWTRPTLVVDPPGPVRAYDPCLWLDPTGRLWLFWAQSYELWDGRGGVWAVTTDRPDSEAPEWSAPRRVGDGVMMNKPTVLDDGTWLLPAAVWNRPAAPAARAAGFGHKLVDRQGSGVLASRDRGATWTPLGKTDVPNRSFDEHMVVERRDGSLWMLVRTKYGQLGESTSADKGMTWSPGGPSDIANIDSRFFIRRLASGALLLVKNSPPSGSKVRSHLTASLSKDDGKTWEGALVLDDRPGVSYPDGVQGPDGTIAVIYDHNRTRDKQILMATFTEADVVAGRPASDAARLRVLVNQATGTAK